MSPLTNPFHKGSQKIFVGTRILNLLSKRDYTHLFLKKDKRFKTVGTTQETVGESRSTPG